MYSYGNSHKNIESTDQRIFNLALILLTVKNMLDSTSIWRRPEIVDVFLLLTIFALLIWKVLRQNYKVWQLVLAVLIGIPCIYTCFHQKYFYLLFSFVCIFSMQNVNLEKSIKNVAFVKTGILLVHVLYFFACRIFAPYLIATFVRNGVIRYSFFLGHPNTFSMYVLWNTFEYLYVYNEKLTSPAIIGLWLINIIFYQITNSNTALLVSTSVYSIVLLEYLIGKRSNSIGLLRVGAGYFFAAFGLFFTLITIFYTSMSGWILDAYEDLNKALTGRLRFGAFAYDVRGLTWFGNNGGFSRKTYWRGFWIDSVVFDNAYIWLLVSYGTIYLIMIAVAFWVIRKRLIKKEALLIIAYCFYGIMENYIINAAICFPLLITGIYLFKEKDKNNELTSG